MYRHLRWAVLLSFLWAASLFALAGPSYDMQVDVEVGTGAYHGTVRVEWTNETGIPLYETVFRLFPNANPLYGQASLEVQEIASSRNLESAMLLADDTVLVIPFSSPLEPEQTASVLLSFAGRASVIEPGIQPDPGEYGILTLAEDSLTLTAFYPVLAPFSDAGWSIAPVLGIGDALFAEAASYHVELTVPSSAAVAASSQAVSVESAGDKTIYEYAVEDARDFSVVLFAQPRLSLHQGPITTWFTSSHQQAGALALADALSAYDLFTDLIGPLPYDHVNVVEVPLQHVAGVELTGLILVSSAYAEYPTDPFYDIIISHEMAHQWFYAAVGDDPSETPWMDESLATYLSYVFLERIRPAAAQPTLLSWQRAYTEAMSRAPDLGVTGPLYAFPDSSTYSAFVYSGGGVELHRLREDLGDHAFFTALSAYYKANVGLIATPQAFRAAFNEVCGCSTGPLLSP